MSSCKKENLWDQSRQINPAFDLWCYKWLRIINTDSEIRQRHRRRFQIWGDSVVLDEWVRKTFTPLVVAFSFSFPFLWRVGVVRLSRGFYGNYLARLSDNRVWIRHWAKGRSSSILNPILYRWAEWLNLELPNAFSCRSLFMLSIILPWTLLLINLRMHLHRSIFTFEISRP